MAGWQHIASSLPDLRLCNLETLARKVTFLGGKLVKTFITSYRSKNSPENSTLQKPLINLRGNATELMFYSLK